MKQMLKGAAVLMMTVLACASCIKDDDTTTSPECAIVSFSVGSIKSYVTTKKYDSEGNATDTIVQRTYSGSDIYFNIDQVNGRIYNVDSLPVWIDLSRVVPSYTCYGSLFGKVVEGDELFYHLTSGKDSIDFSKPVELVCVSTDGLSSKYYTVDIRKHVSATDTLEWKRTRSDLAIVGQNRAFCTDDKVYVFAEQADGQSVVTVASSSDASTWSAPVVIPVAKESVVAFGDNFYGVGSDGYIYTCQKSLAGDGLWTKASDRRVERLLAADSYQLYAYDGSAIIGTRDLNTWKSQGVDDLDQLPDADMNAVAYTTKTTRDIEQVVLTGLSAQNTANGVTWSKLTSADGTFDQPWTYIQVTGDNAYGLPRFAHLSVTYYKGALFAIGTEDGLYKHLYRSDDNGITWHAQTEKYPVPATLDSTEGAASIVAVGSHLWIIQESGKIWRGSIR